MFFPPIIFALLPEAIVITGLLLAERARGESRGTDGAIFRSGVCNWR
jgi:hypothetical protein